MRASLYASLSAILAVSLVTVACGSSTDVASGPNDSGDTSLVGQTSSAIINGQLDTIHQAVVAIVLQQGQQGGLCSGTIVKVDPTTQIGWVLTAAHCVEIQPVFVLQGNDFSQASSVIRYDIVDYLADARWAGQGGSPYDVAVIRIAGVDASTPTIPLVSAPDNLTSGSSVVSVGYGRTTLISSGAADQNTVRRRVSKQLSQVGQTIAYSMQTNGICQGDSGGPVLATVGGQEKVVGVHSYVQGDCNGLGVSSRVTFNASFIAAQLAKEPPAEDCELCTKVANSGTSTCAAATKKCLTDKECGGYYQCLSSGRSKAKCLLQFPKAEGPFNAAANCVCNQACTTVCKGSTDCARVPKCGYELPAGTCAKCTESACCDETLACAADGACYVCLKSGDAAAECGANAARKAMAACVTSKCKADCVGSGLDTGAGQPDAPDDTGTPSPAANATATTTTTTGCAAAPRASSCSPSAFAMAFGMLVVAARRRRRA